MKHENRDTSKPRKIIDRLLTACGSITQQTLARELNIAPQRIVEAISRGQIPDLWIYKVSYKTGRQVEWLRTGHGPEFSQVAAEEMERYRRELPPAIHDLTEQWKALPETERAIIDNALTLLLSSDAETRGLMVDVLHTLVEHRKPSRGKGI